MVAFFESEASREAVAQLALSWVGTPFMAYGRTKGKGVDCIRLVAAILEEAGALPEINWKEFPRYTLDWSAHHDRPILEEAIEYLKLEYIRIESMTQLQPGDVLAFAPGKVVYHLGIYVGSRSFVHAMQGAGVIRTTLSHPTLKRFFRYAMRPAKRSSGSPDPLTGGQETPGSEPAPSGGQETPGSDLRPTTYDLRPEK